MQNTVSITQPITVPHDEQILVVKRTDIFSQNSAWYGLNKEPSEQMITIIKKHKEFHPRSLMEQDPTYKQIIPYLIFNYEDHYFLMQRQAKASESRLQNKYTLGIGGHIRQEDIVNDSIFAWAEREFHEEVFYNGSLEISTMGILNDDTNAVGKVHLGIVLLLKGNSDRISVKSELKSGTMLTKNKITPFFEYMESWSQLVVPFL